LGLFIAIGYKHIGYDILVQAGLPISGKWLETLAFVILFLGTVVITLGVGMILSKIIKPTPLGPVDRILGAVFSGAKVVAIFCLMAVALSLLPPEILQSKALSESSTINATQQYLPYIKKLIREESPIDIPESITKL